MVGGKVALRSEEVAWRLTERWYAEWGESARKGVEARRQAKLAKQLLRIFDGDWTKFVFEADTLSVSKPMYQCQSALGRTHKVEPMELNQQAALSDHGASGRESSRAGLWQAFVIWQLSHAFAER